MTAEQRNILIYVGIWALKVIAVGLSGALAAGLLPGFRDGEVFASARTELAGLLAFVVLTLATVLDAMRPRQGSAHLAAEVDARRAEGVSRKNMLVLSDHEVADLIASQPPERPTATTGDPHEMRLS